MHQEDDELRRADRAHDELQRRADKAHSGGLRRETTYYNDEILGRTDRQAILQCERGSSEPAISHGDGGSEGLQESGSGFAPVFWSGDVAGKIKRCHLIGQFLGWVGVGLSSRCRADGKVWEMGG